MTFEGDITPGKVLSTQERGHQNHKGKTWKKEGQGQGRDFRLNLRKEGSKNLYEQRFGSGRGKKKRVCNTPYQREGEKTRNKAGRNPNWRTSKVR